MKYYTADFWHPLSGRAPQGARGLKFLRKLLLLLMAPVAPRKGRVG